MADFRFAGFTAAEFVGYQLTEVLSCNEKFNKSQLVELVLFTLHRLKLQLHCEYSCQQRTYKYQAASNDMIFTSNFSTTGQLMFIILKLVNKR